LLRCWSREAGLPVPGPGGRLVVPLASSGVAVVAEVLHRSAVGWHRFGPPRLSVAQSASPDALAAPLDAVTLAALLARESASGDAPEAGRADASASVADLVERAAESVRRVASFLADRQAAPAGTADGFLDAEQALLLGHLIHPAPKSRDGISDAEAAAYSPELRGSFPLHWFAADPSIVAHETAAGPDVRSLLADLGQFGSSGRPELSKIAGSGRVLAPAHPWQARDLVSRPAVRELIEAGLLEPLGPVGPRWHPTSSLRTVYRPDASVMLKLSLGLRITNSRRENTRTELARGAEVNRLLDTGIASQVAAAYPRFRIVRDPAWLAVTTFGGALTNLDVSVREVPDGLGSAACLAGLVAPQPGIGPSRLVATVRAIAARAGRRPAEVAAEWIRRHIDHVLAPMIHLYATTGIGLEAHQQNTLVARDTEGWPVAGWFRDNQGYYLAESGLPGVLRLTGATESSLAVADDAIVDDRLTYYLLFNQALAPVGALGSEGVADEAELLGAVRDGLEALVTRGHDSRSGLARRWLDADTLPCKANLATRIAGIDEVIAPLDAQSVYLDVPNPLKEAR
ncbi:MAG: siderophore synthetase, partial [Micromonosporaceae bacterium]|nr:siderophore synthetase [Micromonosporaceae bacterium]